MKTLQIGLEWFPERAGGLPRFYYDLVKIAPAVGIDIKGLVLGSSNINAETNGKIEAFASSSDALVNRLWSAKQAITGQLRTYAPDLVASHFALFTFPALLNIDRPMVVHFQGPWASEGMFEGDKRLSYHVKKAVEQSVYRKANHCIVLSDAFGKILQQDFGINESKIHKIPGGVDYAKFARATTKFEAKENLDWPQDRPILISVRRLVKRMGLEVLIEAMAQVARCHPEVLLMIVGRGPLKDQLQNLIDERGLSRTVRLVGFVSDELLPMAYRAADLSIVPTVALEGFGLIALESLASGTPALVTPVGGLPEVVQNLSDDLIFEGCNESAIADRIIRALRNGDVPDLAACQAHAKTFDWPAIAMRIKEVYNVAIGH